MAKYYDDSEETKKALAELTQIKNSRPSISSEATNSFNAYQDAMERYKNREAFKYDVNADALYDNYKNKYMSQGQLAMKDTLGKASALTGGYGNSYAATVGNQQYLNYMENLANVIPTLNEMAYSRYQDEGNKILQEADAAKDLYGIKYGEYQDSLNDYYKRLANAQDVYANAQANDLAGYKAANDFALEKQKQANDLAIQQLKLQYGSDGADKNKTDANGDTVPYGDKAATTATYNKIANALDEYMSNNDPTGAMEYLTAIAPNLNETQYNTLLKKIGGVTDGYPEGGDAVDLAYYLRSTLNPEHYPVNDDGTVKLKNTTLGKIAQDKQTLLSANPFSNTIAGKYGTLTDTSPLRKNVSSNTDDDNKKKTSTYKSYY